MITVGRLGTVLRQQWHQLAEGEAPRRLSFVVLTKGREPVGKLVFLAVVDGEAQPRFVVKLARLKEHNAAIQTEYLNLRLIARHGGCGRVRTPEPLLCWEEEGRLCLVESLVDGMDLWHATARSRSVAFVAPVVDWLIHLGRTAVGPPSPHPAGAMPQAVERAAAYVATEAERRVLQAAALRLQAVPAAALPQIFEHRDLGTWNITVSRTGAIGILDLESSRPDGFPAADLFYFLAHYGFVTHRARTPADRLQSFAQTFLRGGPFARVAMAAVRRYTSALALDPAWLAPLFLGCWLEHATVEVARVGTTLSDSLFWHMLALTLDHDCRLNFLGAA